MMPIIAGIMEALQLYSSILEIVHGYPYLKDDHPRAIKYD